MKTIPLRLVIIRSFAIALVFNGPLLWGQSWQWAKSGGATDAVPGNGQFEEVRSIATSSDGSIFVTSQVGRTNLLIDGNPRATYSSNGLNDNVVSAFSCDGNYKWSKVVGSFYGSDIIYAGSDNQGNIYATGRVYPSDPQSSPAPHLDNDVILPVSQYNVNTFKQSIYLIKYDANGNYLWHKLPQPSNVSETESLSNTRVNGLQVDDQGNSYIFCLLPLGSYANGAFTVSTKGHFVLKYDSAGNFVGGVDLHIQTAGDWRFNMTRDKISGNFYVAGEVPQGTQSDGDVTINGALQSKSLFVAAFNSTGQFLWKRENTGLKVYGGAQNYNYLTVDAEGSIYFSTRAVYLTDGTGSAPDSFNGLPFQPANTTAITVLVKLDSNGNTLWQTNGNRSWPSGIVVNGGEVAIAGASGNLQWQSLTYQQDANSGNHPVIVRFNKTTGTIIAINAVYSSSDDAGTAIATDSKGNYYLGGRYGGTVTAGPSTLFNNGGGSDFFLAKFGSSDCDFLATADREVEDLQVYPNPVKNAFQLSGGFEGSYQLYNTLGICVRKGKIKAAEKVDVDGLAAGVYTLRLDSRAGQVFKILKE